MSKKPKINKRLDNLFKGLAPEASNAKTTPPPSQPESVSTPPRKTARLKPSRPEKASQPAASIVATQENNAVTYSLDLKTGFEDWSTLLVMDDDSPRQWTADEELLVKQVSDQLSLALENARLFQEAQKFKLGIDRTDNAVFITDPEGVIQYINPGFEKIYGFKNNEALGQTPRILKSGLTPSEQYKELWEKLLTGETVTGEIVNKAKDGTLVYISGTHSPILDENNRILGFLSVNQDITERKKSEEEIRERNEYLAVLNEIMSFTSQTLEIHSILETVLSKILASSKFDSGLITMFNPLRGKLERSVFVRMPGEPPADPAEGLEKSLCRYVFDTRRELVIPNLAFSAPVDVSNEIKAGFRGYLGIPLSAKGNMLGTLCLFRYADEDIPEKTVSLCKTIAVQLGFTIENVRLFELSQVSAADARKSNQELAFINRVIGTLTGAVNLQQAMGAAIHEIVEAFPVSHGAIGIMDEDRKNLNIIADHSKSSRASSAVGVQIPLEENHATQQVIATRKPFFLEDPANNPYLSREIQAEYLKLGISHSVIFPILVNERVVGTLGMDIGSKDVRLEEGQIKLLETIISPISAAISRLRAEEALAKSEADLRVLFTSMEDVVLVYDENGRYIRIAPTNPSRLIKPPAELLGKLIHDVFPKEKADLFLEAIQETLKSGETRQFEYDLRIGDETYWFLANLTKLDEHNVFWVARDITERKKSEETIKRRNEYLAASAEIGKIVTSTLDLNTIFARTVNLINERFRYYHAGIFIVEETGFNAVLREATGEAGKQMKAKRHTLQINDKSIVGKVTMDGQAVVVNDVMTNPQHKFNPLLPETRAEAAIPLRIGARVIGAIDIQSKAVDAFTEDEISVLQTLADQVAVAIDNARSFELSQQAVMELREFDRLKSQFIANMSHELRTPLNSIIGFSRVIIKGIDGPVTDLQQQDLTAIYNSGQHLLGLINDILDLSKIEAGKMELAFDEVNIADIANSVLSTMTGLIKDKPIHLKRVIAPNLPTVRADAIRVRQVMINLLSNAAKFTDEGSITVEVSLKPGQAGRNVVMVSVSDTGPGIATADQSKLFQPFSQVDDSPTRKTGGTGLGLSICQHIINMHGGRIWVESEPGKGSAFYFTLPLFHKETQNASLSGMDKVILTIDDDIQVIELYERYLHPQGYQVIPVTDPSQAMERIKQFKPYAVTLDIMMPGIDGWQVLDQLKSNPDTRNIPVIVCSIIEDLHKGFNLGATDYLVKPILEEDLVNALDRLNIDGSIRDVLVIDDNPDDLRLIAKILTDDGRYKAIIAEGGRMGWDLLSSGKPPHVVVLDLFMPEVDGFKILENMQASDNLRDIPVVVISGMDLTTEQKNQLSEFGQRMLSKGAFNAKELLTSLQRSLERVHK
jgi:PAS domain S-box-containing protein